MSCQQASRFITTNNSSNSIVNSNTVTNANCKILNNSKQNHSVLKGNLITRGVIQQEDPYVFTESVPTTPPILFNTQKTRTRLSDISPGCVGNLQQQKLPLTEANGKITANLHQIKTQASFLSSTTTIATTNSCSLPASKNNVNQSFTATTTTITNNHSNNKKQTNVCIVRPQLQTQQSHYHQNFINSSPIYEGDLKSISPPPLYTPPTPSLWQTPLLLETTASTNAKVSDVMALKSSTTAASQNVPIMGCVTPTVQTVGSTTNSMNSSLTTTAMAKVAPIIFHTPLASPPPLSLAQTPKQCLPPSKFHNHTLAQHLQNVECLKKSVKPTEADNVFCNEKDNIITSPFKSSSPSALSKTASLNAINSSSNPDNHSENEDLNEIPVNVIFRMAVVPQANDESSQNLQNVQTQPIQKAPASAPNATELKTNVSRKLSIPASKTTATKQQQQQTDTSSIPQQECNATKTTKILALNSQQHRMPNEADESTSDTPTNTENSTKTSKSPTHITTSKTRKLNTSPTTSHSVDLQHNWQMGCCTTKGAVAIVKMSRHCVDLDNSHLATAAGLPYCLQKHWLTSYGMVKSTPGLLLREKSLLNLSLVREERIALYRQQLRRQAMQLFSTRSLQKLPLKVAKRRLLCVDQLLKKYQQTKQNWKELPANVKRCCVNGCDAYTLEMASHCQQHIVCNAAQHVFLPCTAKFADNTQCRVPVFDITHDLPLCTEHARKRDAYNRLLYEQRPRKISTNPVLINESITLTPKLSSTNSNAELLPSGVLVRTQNNHHKQKLQHEQHLMQQLPANNSSHSNKRPALVNQQARKRKMTVGLTANPVGRPQKRAKKTVEKSVGSLTTATKIKQMPRLTSTCLKRKSSTTSLESIASNSQHSTTSSTSQHLLQYQRQQQQNTYGVMPTTSLAPPALAPLSGGLVGHGLPQHLFSFGHDNNHSTRSPNKIQYHQHQQTLHPINLNDKHSFSDSTTSITTASTPTELKDFISQFHAQKQTPQVETSTADANLLNSNSNSNFTSSGMGSTSSLPTADDFLTQDMLSICENSSASSADTGLGGLSDAELMLGGPDDDIPLGDTHLLEEHDLENVLNSLPEDAFKELFTTVHQDESDEIERAIELADKHLKTLQQTIGTELGDFLDFNDDILMHNGDLCNGSSANTILDTSALFIGGGTVGGTTSLAVSAAQGSQGGAGGDIRGLVQT